MRVTDGLCSPWPSIEAILKTFTFAAIANGGCNAGAWRQEGTEEDRARAAFYSRGRGQFSGVLFYVQYHGPLNYFGVLRSWIEPRVSRSQASFAFSTPSRSRGKGGKATAV